MCIRDRRYANMMLALQGIIPDSNYPRVDKDRRAYVKLHAPEAKKVIFEMCIRDRLRCIPYEGR